jgi:PAS domain S-box-containing protein
MTKRFWRFSSVALIGTIVVAVALALAYGRLTVKNLTELGAEQNGALARSISNAARTPLEGLLGQAPDLSVAELRNSAASSELPSVISSLIRDLSVVKVKVFNAHGITIFATDPAQIGEVASGNPGFIAAMADKTISDIVRRDTLNSFDQVIETRDLIQTYIPIRNPDDEITGVFEVYSDVTPLLARIASTQRGITAGVIGSLGLLYILLVWLYRRTDRRLQEEQATTQAYLEEIEAAKATLEERVAERTRMLEKSRNFLQTALDGVPDPALVIDKDYRVKSMNKAARIAFGIDKEKGEPIFCYRAMHGLSAPCDDADHPCTLLSGDPCKRVESRINDTGKFQQVEIRTTPLRGPDGEITGAIEVVHDLNEREQVAYRLRQAKERAETASQVKSEFVAMMSHEIRTPMNAVLGMTDLLRLTELTRKQQGYIQTIQSSGNMLLSLVDNILDFSRLGAGALKLQSHEFGVIELLERVLKITGYHAYLKGLELAGIFDANMRLRVSGDENRLCQILVNLVSNAVKFSEQGEIIVSVGVRSESSKTTELLFSVTDCGIGMTDEVKQQIFTPFTKVDEQAAGKQQGTGLGLAICKQLVEYMGGEIGVDSQPGEGTRIWFTVPVESRAPAKSDLTCRIPALQGQRVLTICGNPSIAQVICSYTKAWDMSCDIAASAEEALDRLQAGSVNGQAYGLAIIDNATSSLDGLKLARQIRSTDDVKALPVILLTPISRPLEPGEISSIGRILCVNKPVLPSELQLTLFKIMGLKEDPDTADEVESSGNGEKNGIRILVAEDNLVNRRVLTGMLNSLNYSAECVEDGPAVLAALDEAPYDIVLMDCQMPGMDGEQVSEQIRQDQGRFQNQPVIVAITADASLEHRAACLTAGMDDFIAKPLRLAKLRKGLRRWKAMAIARTTDDEDIGALSDFLVNQQARDQLRDRAAEQDATFLNGYIDLFLQDTASRLDSLEAAFAKHDLDTLRRESHTLKGACLEFGVVRMSRYCDEIRHSAKDEKFDQAPYLLHSLRKEFDRIRPVLEAEKPG